MTSRKTFKWGILFARDEEDILFIRKVVRIPSPKWWIGTLALSNKVRAISTRSIFFILAIPFYYGVHGHVDWWKIPCEDKKSISRVFFSIVT